MRQLTTKKRKNFPKKPNFSKFVCDNRTEMFEDFRLKVFTEVAEAGSFTAAARRLGITQPAVSQNIAEIENAYGIKLFDRTNKTMGLTPEGRVFKAYVGKLLQGYRELDTIFSNYDAITSLKTLRISVSRDALVETSATLLPYIYDICPDITVSLVLEGEPSETEPDIVITGSGRLRQTIASESFQANPLWKLLQ